MAADTIEFTAPLPALGTGVITLFLERRMKKTRKMRREKKKDGMMMIGQPKLIIRTVNSDMPGPPIDSCSCIFNTSTAVYLPWLPVIIIIMSFSSRHTLVVWPQTNTDE